VIYDGEARTRGVAPLTRGIDASEDAMSDRLALANALANAIEEAGIERAKAERVASVIFDAIHHNVVTSAACRATGHRN
jgi:hypothetical protein